MQTEDPVVVVAPEDLEVVVTVDKVVAIIVLRLTVPAEDDDELERLPPLEPLPTTMTS